jgi:hypothetical protein
MKAIEYIAEILPDGHLSVPDSVIKKFNLKSRSKLRISIFPIKNDSKALARFCGKWQEDRRADDIIKDIYKSRSQNSRSGRIKF